MVKNKNRAKTRKQMAVGFGMTFILLCGVFFSGPVVEIDTTIHAVNLPEDFEQYVAESEARFSDIVPGTEKTIIWAGDAGVKTPLSVVYLHGFSASRQETAPLSERVAERLTANLFYTRFTGHGRGGDAMLDGSVNAWLNDTCEALEIGRRLGKKVVVIGVSTGGTAAAWLAAQIRVDDVAAFVLISPNFGPADPLSRCLLWPWGGNIARMIIGPERSWTPDNEEQGTYWTHQYPTRALLPMMGMVSLAESLSFETITAPTLVIYSPEDKIVSVRAIQKMAGKIGAAQKKVMAYTGSGDSSQHILAGKILSPGSTEELAAVIADFVNSNTAR